MDKDVWDDIKETVQRVQVQMTTTSITCSRTIRGSHGDEYVAMSVGIDSTKSEEPADQIVVSEGMPLKDAPIAAALLSMQVDISAHEHAASSGVVTPVYAANAIKMIKVNYVHLLEKAVKQAEKASKSRD